ncbi:MAG: FlgD immunoglobulin-like domain containing protein [candidate division Zixibacteria bacterium]|nr:FlgD immunoglobulin-like domain containing protein [candidate division Zixibacteria bacterium]
MKHLIIPSLFILVMGLLPTVLLSQTIDGLSIRPPDSVEAERVRIWVPVEKTSRCRVRINIMDSTGDTVRHFVNFLPNPGYYNFYWDKKDDSGRRVPAGTYPYVIEDCGDHKRRREVIAKYSRWEEISTIVPPDSAHPFRIELELDEDSARCSLRYYTHREYQIDSLFVDSLLNKGKYQFNWNPSWKIRPGNYIIKLMIGNYVYVRKVTYTR